MIFRFLLTLESEEGVGGARFGLLDDTVAAVGLTMEEARRLAVDQSLGRGPAKASIAVG